MKYPSPGTKSIPHAAELILLMYKSVGTVHREINVGKIKPKINTKKFIL